MLKGVNTNFDIFTKIHHTVDDISYEKLSYQTFVYKCKIDLLYLIGLVRSFSCKKRDNFRRVEFFSLFWQNSEYSVDVFVVHVLDKFNNQAIFY